MSVLVTLSFSRTETLLNNVSSAKPSVSVDNSVRTGKNRYFKTTHKKRPSFAA